MFIRRAFFVPAGVTYEWFEFFSVNSHVYWSDRVLSSFIQYPYNQSIPKTVGEYMYSPDLAANSGFIGSGFAHGGLIGVAIYALLLDFIIRIFNQLSRDGVPIWFSLAITAGPIRTSLLDQRPPDRDLKSWTICCSGDPNFIPGSYKPSEQF